MLAIRLEKPVLALYKLLNKLALAHRLLLTLLGRKQQVDNKR